MEAWLAAAGCLAVSFVFSGIEAGILSLNRVQLRHRAKAKDSSAILLSRLLQDPESVLVTVLLVTNLMRLLALALAVREAVLWMGDAGYFAVGMVALPVWILGLELLPKVLFRRIPYRALAVLSGPLRTMDFLLSPLHFAGRWLTRLLLGSESLHHLKLFAGREDFKVLAAESARVGNLSKEESSVIHSVLDFRQLKASDVMVRLDAAGAVSGAVSLVEAREQAARLGLDKLPVLDEAGRVSGFLDLHELALQGQWHGQAEVFQRRVLKGELYESAYSLMRKLRAARLPMAAVRDAHGDTPGVVLWDDLIRRLLSPPASAGGAPSGAGRVEESR